MLIFTIPDANLCIFAVLYERELSNINDNKQIYLNA